MPSQIRTEPRMLGGGLSALKKSVLDADFVDGGGSALAPGSDAIAATVYKAASRELTPKEQYELSIDVRKCVGVISRNISQVKIRVFKSDGREVTGGPLFNLLRHPSPSMSRQKFLTELVTWLNLCGEMPIKVSADAGGQPNALYPLDPSMLSIEKPSNPKHMGEVMQWRYYWLNGTCEYIRADYLLFDRLFNPFHTIRGLSPLVTGAVEVATGYHIGVYNKTFFENGGIPSHILNLGEGVGRLQREDIERKYREMYGNFAGNAHRVMVASGKGLKVETLDQPFQDGAFMDLRQSVKQSVAQLYGVPAIEAGFYDKTRFDTAAEERKLFVDSTLTPQCSAIDQMLQIQLVDRHFRFSEINHERSRFTKSMGDRFEEARDSRPESDLIVLLDLDTLPIMAQVTAAKIAAAKEFRDTLMLSANETAQFHGIEIPFRPERDDIWVERTRVNITDPKMNGDIAGAEMAAKQKINAGQADPSKPAEPKPAVQKSAVKLLMHKLRKLAMKSLDVGQLFSLAEADTLAGDDATLKTLVRLFHHELRDVPNADDPAAAARAVFKTFTAGAKL